MMNEEYNSVILTIIAVILLLILMGVAKINIALINEFSADDLKVEKIIHFNRWYDVQMFKGTQLNIDENRESSPFDDKNKMDGSHIDLIEKGEKNSESQNSQKNTK